MRSARLHAGDSVLTMDNFLRKFLVLINYKGNFTSFLTKVFLGTYIDHLEFDISPAVISIFLKNQKRYVGSVCTKFLLGSFTKRRKNILKISLKIK